MSRKSLSIKDYNNTGENDVLAIQFAGVIENLQTGLITNELKNKAQRGMSVKGGSVSFKRFVNAQADDYKTAKTNQQGREIVATNIFVNLDKNREIVEEIESTDIAQYGVEGIVNMRIDNMTTRVMVELEREFFKVVTNGIKHTPVGITVIDQFLDLVASLEETQSDFVDGVPTEQIAVICDRKTYDQLRQYIDGTALRSGVSIENDRFKYIHGIAVATSRYLPTGVSMVAMHIGAIAQPTIIYPFTLRDTTHSNSKVLPMFFDYGTGIIESELVRYISATTPIKTTTKE